MSMVFCRSSNKTNTTNIDIFNNIFGIRCVSLLGIYLSAPELDKDYQNRFIFFNEHFLGNIETPKTITDLINLL